MLFNRFNRHPPLLLTPLQADDFDLLKRSLPDVPSSLKINAKKRSLPPDDSGNYRIQLADKIFISYTHVASFLLPSHNSTGPRSPSC